MAQLSHIISIIFGAGFTLAVMWAAGLLLFQRLDVRLHTLERDLLAVPVGGALLSLAVFILCATGAARTPIFLVLGIALVGLAWRFSATAGGPLPPVPLLWKWLFGVPFTIYAVIYLSNSLAPEVSPDGAAYHLGFVFRYFREHGFHRLTTNLYGNLSQGVEMLFLFAFAFGRQSAAATVHCCYLLALPLLMLSYGRRIGHPRAGIGAAMLVFLSPLMGIDGVSAYNDVALATTAFALFYLLEIWREENQRSLLVPIGIAAGFCFAIKATGIVGFLYAATVILMRKKPRALVTVVAMAAMIALPWPVKDWLWLGNPASPFLNRAFPNPYVHVDFEEDYRNYSRHYELTSLRQWPLAVTVRGDLAGQLGPLFLLAPIALFALRLREGKQSLLAALFFLVLYPANIDARFLLPTLPFVALAMALAIEVSTVALTLLMVAAFVLALPPVTAMYRGPAGAWRIEGIPWRAALRITPQDEYLAAHSVAWINATMLDYYVPQGKRVWSTTPIAESYSKTDVMIGYQSAEGELIGDILAIPTHENLMPTKDLQFNFAKRPVRHLRIAETANGTGVKDTWSIGEMKIFDGTSEVLPTGTTWHLDATPYPWDIGLAFDNNPTTRWSSWQTYRGGMHVDVDFGTPVEIDRVELDVANDQPGVRVHPETCDAGACVPIPTILKTADDPPAADLRPVATRTVKGRGIDYLVVDDGYWTAADMRHDPARWGMEFITERAGNRLYKINE